MRRPKHGKGDEAKGKFFAKIIKVLFKKDVTPNKSDDEEAATPGTGGGAPAILQDDVDGWRPAEAILKLRAQIDRMAPNRSKASDGIIGDASHQTRNSDHNPWVIDGKTGVVTAIDITNDPKHGCSAEAIANAIVAAKDPRVKYVIWNKRINNSQVSPWKWRAYTGKNPHTKHVHVSSCPTRRTTTTRPTGT